MNIQDKTTAGLKAEVKSQCTGVYLCDYYMGIGYKQDLTAPIPIARANAFRALITKSEKCIYKNDLIVGSMRG